MRCVNDAIGVVASTVWVDFTRTLLAVAALLGAASGSAQEFQPLPFPAPRFELQGFSVLPPAGERWLMRSGATRNYVEFHRSTDLRGAHTVLAWVRTFDWPDPKAGADDVQRQIAALIAGDFGDPSRFAKLRTAVTRTRVAGLDCTEFSFSVQDRGVPYAPGAVFNMQGWEVYCVHPSAATPVVLNLAHSQRFQQGGRPLDLEPELKPFREQVRVTAVNQ